MNPSQPDVRKPDGTTSGPMEEAAAARLAGLADSYLDHIRIAVEAGDRGASFRNFIDNWAAFASPTGHNRTASHRPIRFNNPDAVGRRAMLDSLPFRSVGAAGVLRDSAERPHEYRARLLSGDRDVRLVVDHAVPLAVLVGLLFEPGADLTREGIGGLLRRLHRLGLLSGAENARLDAAHLRSSMPPGRDGIDLWARYRAAGIEADGGVGSTEAK